MKALALLLALTTLLAASSASAAVTRAADVPRHEISLGFGWAGSFEKSIFNVSPDIASTPEMAMSLSYLFDLDSHWAVGLHVYGTDETTAELAIEDPGGFTHLTSFDLFTSNFGVRARYTVLRGTITPYVYAGASLASGSIESRSTGTLDYSGWSFCAGPGASLALGRSWRAGLEGFVSMGRANWKDMPFVNSSSRDFDPSIAGVLLNFSVVWGRAGDEGQR